MAPARGWFRSSTLPAKMVWLALGGLTVGVLAIWAVADASTAPSVPSVMLAALALVGAVALYTMLAEAVASSMVHLSPQAYAAPVSPARRWEDVLAISTGQVEGRRVPVVALRVPEGGFPLSQDVFTGFVDADADRLVSAMLQWRPEAADASFAGVVVPQSWWAEVDAEAERVTDTVAAASGRRPVARERIEFGYPGLASAVRLDYGPNQAGEGVEVIVKRTAELAVVIDGTRYLRQRRKRTPEAATEVEALFGDHTTIVHPGDGLAFDEAVVTTADGVALRFNAEEPDRF